MADLVRPVPLTQLPPPTCSSISLIDSEIKKKYFGYYIRNFPKSIYAQLTEVKQVFICA